MMRFVVRLFTLAGCLVPLLASADSVVINELMYDPASHGTNEEWIEIYNTGTNSVSLMGWKFTKGVDFTFTTPVSIPAGGYFVVAANVAVFSAAHPGVDGDFVTGGWVGTLANSGETIQLEDAAGNNVDEITYADHGDWATRIRGPLDLNHRGWDWSARHQGTGRSAELVNPNQPNDSGQNWAASSVDGGTPGAPNSVLNVSGRALILETAHLPLVPRSTNSITITSKILDPLGAGTTVRLFYRVDANPQTSPFTAVTMSDNGLSGDGIAGDGVYGAVLAASPNGTVIEYYVEAVTQGGMTNSWPALASIDGVLSHSANALLQVDDSVYSGGQPIYRLIMTEAERSELNTINNSGDRGSDAQMNGTLISFDGFSSELRYLLGIRIRGAGSRGANPPNYRVNIPIDRRWKGISQINLNTQFTHAQMAGYALASHSGMNTESARAVQVRVNGVNLASANSPQFGSYVATEVPNGDFVDAHFPQDDGGNIYRASSGSHSATLAYLGTNISSYVNAGYSKEDNSTENDWTDLFNLTFALSPGTPNSSYVEAVRQVVNVDEWMLYFSLFTLTLSGETSLGTGYGDDFGMYRGSIDPRFHLLTHDWDTILGQGSGANFSTGTNLFRATAVTAINRFLRHPEFVPTYYATLKRLLDTSFSDGEVARTLDEVLGSWVPAGTITAMKTFATNRNAYVRSQIPLQLTASSPLPFVLGFPQSSTGTAPLNGFSDVINTRTVLVNGSTSVWSAWEGRWTHNSVALQPGINRVLVQALGTNGLEIARTNIDIWYNVAATPMSGPISTDTTWVPDNGPYSISGTLTIAAGATLTIEPGASVYFGSGGRITVADGGRLIAEGTEFLPIRFTRVPGAANTWGGITIDGTPGSPESRIGYAHIEFNNGTAIDVQGGEVALHHLTFGTTDRRYLNFDDASFTVSDCYFPGTTASIEPIHGTGGIRSGGHGIFVRNFCGKVIGYNDTIDFTGGNRPGPVIHIIDNVFMGSDDDILDLDGTDAWVEGNIFLHVHRNGSPDSASAVSGGNDSGQTSEITVIGNIFYDVDQAATAKQGNFYTFINNTVVRQTGAGFGDAAVAAVLNFADDGFALASGMYVEGNIVVDARGLTRYVTNGTALASNITFNNNLMPFSWFGPGTNNSTDDPLLIYIPQLAETTNFTTWQSAQVMRSWFATHFGSPARDNGPSGRHKGAGGPFRLGASISGEPAPVTATNGATLTVGINRTVPGWPSGSGFTHYKWRLDSGAWSAETPIASPIVLSNLANGAHRVDVSGKRDSGLYQDDPLFAPDAVVSQSQTWLVTNLSGKVVINEVLARNARAFIHEDETPDVVELFNPGTTTVDLSGKGMTDDSAIHYKFVFPTNTLLGPGQYLLVYADIEKITSGLHLGFALNQNGDSIYLYDSVANGGALMDSITFGLQIDDLSIGRIPNGLWFLTFPTLGAANSPHPFGDVSNLKINEWLTDETIGNDFVEVFNRDTLPVNIGGSSFSDSPASAPMLHQVPPLSFLPAKAYFAFTADGDAGQGADHLSFKLSPDQGAIALFATNGALIDWVIYGPQTTDISEGRTPNGTDTRGFFVQPTPGAANPVNLSGTNITSETINLVSFNDVWRFNQTANLDGVNWNTTNYNDSSWSEGAGVLAEENCGCLPQAIDTFLSVGRITYYFRTTFVLNTNLSGMTLSLNALIDDGAVIYLNGTELMRVRVGGGTVLYSTLALNPSVGDATLETFTLPGTNMVQGTNLIAVEVHQQSAGSSDIVWGMALDAVRSTTNITQFNIVLNEVMANNTSYTNADGTITDWLEIYNPGGSAADLSDMSLTDDVATPRRWVFPSGVSIPPLSYLLVKFDPGAPASTNAGPTMNTGFGFDAGGDKVLLFDKPSRGGALLDSIQFGLQAADFTIGRIPNGTGPWALSLPTEGSANIVAALGNASALRINEWMADPKSGDDDYFELYNPNQQPVNLSGMYLTDNLNNRTQYRIPNLSFIGVNLRGFVEFIADNDPEQGADHTNFRLAAAGESIGLFDTDGLKLIDTITFGLQQNGVSQGRFPDGNANIVRFPETPTPGQANFLPFNDVLINEALTHSDPPLEDAIELFNPTASPINIGGWYLSDSQLEPRKFRIPDNTILQAGGFVVFYEYQFNPTLLFPSFSLSSANGDEIFLSLTDTNGNLTGYRTSVDFGPQVNGVTFGQFETSIGFDFVAMSARTLGVDGPATTNEFRTGQGETNAYPKVGSVTINEIHYRPPDVGTNDNTQDEFIELYNSSASAVPLFDSAHPTNTWHLRDAVDFDFPTNTSIPAGGYLLVVGFDPVTNVTALAAFRAKYGLGPNVAIVGPFDGKLNNDEDDIHLNAPDEPNNGDAPYVLVERVHYHDSAPWPSAADGNTNGAGISLQRIVAQNYANDPVNWIAGVPTPGAANGVAVFTPPSITLQPTNRTVLPASSVTFVAAASGTAPLRYQWRFNGFDVSDATNASFTVASAQTTNAGGYSVRVVNPAGAALSATAFLVLQSPPQIVFQPQNRNVAAGATVSFTVGARGTAPLGYQWWKDGVTIGGATQPTLVISNVQSGDLGNYFVVVANSFGSVTSSFASLQLSVPPQITSQPSNQSVIIGQTATFSVTASGSTPLSYQWRFNGGDLSGATSSNLVFSNVQPSRAGTYSVQVSNIVGTVSSFNVTLIVIVPPTLTLVATDPNASETGPDPGAFTITRNGSNNVPLTVNLNIGGSAQNGADYQTIPTQVTIPAGTNSVRISVAPVDDAIIESSETAVLTLAPSLNYLIGSPSNATVTIGDNDNRPPVVAITAPTNNTFLPVTPTNIFLAATASDPNAGQGVSVRFYFGTNNVSPALVPPYQFTWTNLFSGSNALTAVATDDLGLSSTSAPIALSINGPPTVSIASPINGAAVFPPGNVVITASATDTNGGVAQVDFYVGGTLIGSTTTAPYSATLSNAALGPYQTFAVARDTFGLSATSAVVNFTVTVASTNLADSFNNRGVINNVTNFLTANNNSATLEAGEPNHYFGHAVKTMWLQWTAPANGTVTMDTIGSGFDTILAVYTNRPGVGLSFASLVQVTVNDDSVGLQSRVSFAATFGMTYYVVIGGYDTASPNGGAVQFHLGLPGVPFITTQPVSQTNDVGSSVTFTVVANSGSPLTYQWRFNGGNLSGATSASLTVTNIQQSSAGNYDVRVSNTSGSVTSAVAVLALRLGPPPVARLVSPRVTNGVFTATLSGGVTNRGYIVETSLNLTNWTYLLTLVNSNGNVTFTDTNVPPPGVLRAYRANLGP